jgi:hypothetical protein
MKTQSINKYSLSSELYLYSFLMSYPANHNVQPAEKQHIRVQIIEFFKM